MRKKHIPIRMCVVCKTRFPKQEMARFVGPRHQAQGAVYDRAQTLSGRGFYVCAGEVCGERFSKSWGRQEGVQRV
ncbi:MAG: DUF448 domain-containing protein [Thermodesulfobacteriota bacterium]|nr:DUF448 domain-containing protein [Thermodesulfobacteriota bacterium]